MSKTGKKSGKAKKAISVASVIEDYMAKVKTAEETSKILLRASKEDLFEEFVKIQQEQSLASNMAFENQTKADMVTMLLIHYDPNKVVAGELTVEYGDGMAMAYDEAATEIVVDTAKEIFPALSEVHGHYKSNSDWADAEIRVKDIWAASGIEEKRIAAVYNKALKSPFGFRFSVADVELIACVWVERSKYRMSVYNKAGERVVFIK